MTRRLIGQHPYLTLGTIAATAFLVHNCSEDRAVVFTSADQCLTSNMDPAVCRLAAEDAIQDRLASAPRYRNMAACEMNYGPRNCLEHAGDQVPNNPDGLPAFIPKMSGFVLSSRIRNLDDYHAFRRKKEQEEGSSSSGTTVYRNTSGQTVTAFAEKPGGEKGTTTQGANDLKHFNVKTQSASRGGFGVRLFSGG
jgi:uncharacterized protein YgiB involved in biofilm formation